MVGRNGGMEKVGEKGQGQVQVQESQGKVYIGFLKVKVKCVDLRGNKGKFFLRAIFYMDPVKNMAGIPMEILCHLVSQIDGSLVHIVTEFDDHSMSFIVCRF